LTYNLFYISAETHSKAALTPKSQYVLNS